MEELKKGRGSIIEEDENGNIHFNGTIRNAAELEEKTESQG